MERMRLSEMIYTEEEMQELREENKKLKERVSELEDVSKDYDLLSKDFIALGEENKKLNIKVASLEGEIKGLNSVIEKLREENQYRESIADVLPEGEGHIAEETIQDLQKEIKELKNMINTAIGIAYDKDDYDGIEYLVHERDRSEYFTSKQIKDGKTKGEGSSND